ncbi:MAG: phosphatase PAP2 family protein [Xanthobacteraceae bacterium]
MIHQRTALTVHIAWTLLALALLAWLAAALSSASVRNFDAAVRLGIHQWASPTLTELMQAITVLGSVRFLGSALAIAIAGFLMAGWRQSAVALAWIMAGAIVLENTMKYAVHRVRPEPFFGTEPDTYGFPSGHALLSSCFYWVLAEVLAGRSRSVFARATIWTVAAALIAAIGLSRIYLGVHYPTDVLGGYLTAAFWVGTLKSIRGLQWCRCARGPRRDASS